MGWFARLFGGGKPPPAKPSRVAQVLRRASQPGPDTRCVATVEEGRVVALYLQDAQQLSDAEWVELLSHDTVAPHLRSLDLVFLEDGPKQVLRRMRFPALRRLVVGSLAYDVGDMAHTINNVGWGAQGSVEGVAGIAPQLEELVLRGVEGLSQLPATLRSLTWVSLASHHPDTLELGPEGTLAALEELVLIDAPSQPFATRSDLARLARLVVTPSGLEDWSDTPLPALASVEVVSAFGVDQDTIDTLVALRDRTGASVQVFAEPDGIEVDDDRGVPMPWVGDHPLRGELEQPG